MMITDAAAEVRHAREDEFKPPLRCRQKSVVMVAYSGSARAGFSTGQKKAGTGLLFFFSVSFAA